jgi:hypothetical protein
MDAGAFAADTGAAMMSLPVFATVATTYRFFFREFGTVIRFAWFPLLVVAVVQYFAAEASLDALAAGQSGSDQPIASPYDLVEWIVQIVVFAIVGVSLHRVILFGDRKPGQYIAFAFGRAEVLFLFLQLIVFAAYFVIGVVWAIVLREPGAAPSSSGIGQILMVIAIAAALIYVFTRLAPAYPIVVAENRLDFPRSWELTRGKFWRLLAILWLGLLPLGLVIALAEAVFVGLASRSLAGRELSSEQVVAIKALIVYQVGIFYVVAIAASGLTAALLCYSYKALRGLKPDALLTPEYQVRP